MEVTLYQFESCPFCATVRDKLEEKKIKYKTVNVSRDRDAPDRQKIAINAGVSTVPVVDFDGSWVGESGDIIDFIDNHF